MAAAPVTQSDRITMALVDMSKTSELLINALLTAIPEECLGDDDLQQAMLTYMEGNAKFQADVAMFMAQTKVSDD